VSSRQDVEVALRDWFAARLGAPDVAIEDLHRHDEGFSWRTYTLDVRWRDEEGAERVHGYAARVEPEDGLLAPYDIEYQYGVHRLVSEHSTVPIPKLGWLELDPSVLDMPFYVMDRVRAVVPVQWRPDDPEIFPTDAAREAIGLAFIDVQAAIAATDWRRFGGGLFADPGTPEQSAAAQVEYWTDYYEQARLV
jgi:aminoglycoside phosphotransferase (APT) family kinase protein